MSRVRSLAIATLLATAALLVPASAASAAAKLTATIVCDAQTGAITTSVAGPLVQPGAPRSVTVEFKRHDAVNVSTTARTDIGPLATPFKVTVSTRPDGSVRANGYTSTFDPATSFYYQESVDVFLRNSAGVLYAARTATCKRDVRTTVTLTCDGSTGTLTAAIRGTDAQTGGADVRPTRVRYSETSITQTGPDDSVWSGTSLGWEYDHRVNPAADGTWTDPGYTKSSGGPITTYYSAREIRVGVFNQSNQLVGDASAKCVMNDDRVTSQS